MGTGPGASYDIYGRTIAEHLGKHIPGNPNIIVEHMPGAGGVVAANHIYGPAPQDGSRLLLSHALPLIERMSPKGVQYECRKLQWLGSYDAIAQMMAIWHEAPVKSLDELKNGDFVVGSFNRTHFSYQWAMLTKVHPRRQLPRHHRLSERQPSQPGDGARRDRRLDRLLGELRRRPAGLAARQEGQILRGLHARADARTAGRADAGRAVAARAAGDAGIHRFGHAVRARPGGRPGVPADRVAALRKAFDDLMVDKEFLALAEKRKLDIHPRNAAATNALLDKVVGASPEFVARVMKAIE